ncbi:hypothetical protein, partial [Planotetraspora phitsanulokensis]|uniref:hypothetical protein n=1 Tax=Planotetraspora phitsanulokensis TaxID=575192 RepID=UPI00194EC51B
ASPPPSEPAWASAWPGASDPEEASRDDSASEGDSPDPAKRNTENGKRAEARRGVPDPEGDIPEAPDDSERALEESWRGEFRGENGTESFREESGRENDEESS